MQDNGFKCEPPKKDKVVEGLVKNHEYLLQQLIDLKEEVKNLKDEVEELKASNFIKTQEPFENR